MHIEINEVLNVSPQDFYDYMIDTIIEQIEMDLDVQLERKDIKTGYTHRVKSVDKKTGKTSRMRYTIKDAKRPERFVVVFSTAEHTTKVTYEFKSIEEGKKTDFLYIMDKQYADSSQEPKGWRAKFSQRTTRSRFVRSIKAAQKDCLARLNEEQEEQEEQQ